MKGVVPIDDASVAASAAASMDLCCHSTSAPSSPELAVARDLPPSPAPRVPFDWEDKPGTPKFHLIGSEKTVEPMLKPPPRLQYPASDGWARNSVSSPRSPFMSPRRLWGSVRRSRGAGGGGGVEEFDPFAIAILEASGRERAPPANPSDRRRSGKWRLRELLLHQSASPKLARSHSIAFSSWGLIKKRVEAEEGHDRDFCAEDDGAAAAAVEEDTKKKKELRRRQGMLGWILFNASGRCRLDRGR